VSNDAESLPSNLAAAHAMILAERAARLESEARAAQIEADLSRSKAAASGVDALVVHLRLEIEKLRRAVYGVRSERKQRLLDQLEMQLEDAEAGATEDEMAAERSAPSTLVKSFERRRPVRKPFPEHLPRERVVIVAPASCPCCGSTKLSKLGEDVTETLEVVPRQWKVIQTVRERFSCRQCEAISQPPAPFHVTPRGFAGPNLLAMVLFEKFGQHQPLNRQSERYAREGIDLSLSTLADQVGACATALRPLHTLIEGHVLAAERLHGDDTTVPILAKGKTETGRIWVYVRDDRPFGGPDPPAALFYASRDRTREHPESHLAGWSGILQADAYGGYNRLYLPDRRPGPIVEALCWSHYLEPVFIRSGGLMPRSWPTTSGRRTRHKFTRSERLQEGEKVWLGRPGLGPRGFDSGMFPECLQRIALHLQVRGDVPAGRGDAGMAKIVADHGHVGAGLQQRHGAAVTQHMRRDPLAREHRSLLCRDS